MKYLRHISLDVSLGSILMAYFFASFGEVEVSWVEYLVLGLSVWLIYTADHLLDAYKITHVAHTPRYKFHQDHFEKIIIVACVVLLLTTWLTFTKLPIRTIRYGFMMSGLVFLHFGLAMIEAFKHKLVFQKEVRVALVYALGISLPTLSKTGIVSNHLLVMGMVFLQALSNLLIISYYEYGSDKADHQMSTAVVLGIKKTYRMIGVVLSTFFLLWFAGFFFALPILHLLVLGIMSLSLFLIYWQKELFEVNERYRILADLVFVFPIILLI